MRENEEFGPLKGLKVLDIGTLLASPFGASLLADFGADVIKVELPRVGDNIRRIGKTSSNGNSLSWSINARNKRCITLDMRKEEGRELMKKLVKWADILMENFTPGTLESWDLGYEQLSEINPRLVMVRISGYGQTGPNSKKPGLDRIALAFSGLKYITGYPDQPPVRMGVTIADYLTGTFGALASLMAVYNRDVVGTGKGQMIDLGLYEAPLRISEDIISTYGVYGEVRERVGNKHRSLVPAEVFETKDGRWITLSAGLDSAFRRLTIAMEQEELANDPRFSSIKERAAHADEIHAIVRKWVKKYTADEILSVLERADVPSGLVYNIADIFKDPHIAFRENIEEVCDLSGRKIPVPGITPKFSDTPGKIAWAGRSLGADNDDIYLNLLQLDPDEYEQLKEKNVI